MEAMNQWQVEKLKDHVMQIILKCGDQSHYFRGGGEGTERQMKQRRNTNGKLLTSIIFWKESRASKYDLKNAIKHSQTHGIESNIVLIQI